MLPFGHQIRALIAELRRRRVLRPAGVYLVAAWAVVEVSTTVLPLLGSPDWVARVVLAFVAAGFPVALVVAWRFDIVPGGVRVEGAKGDVSDRQVRMSQAVLITAAAVIGLAVPVFLTLQLLQGPHDGEEGAAHEGPALDAQRVTVFPFRASSSLDGALGEDVSTVIAHSLDGAGGLRSLDGWSVMTPEERADVRLLTDTRLRELAASRRSRYALTGQIVALSGEDVEVIVRLHDIAADSTYPSRASEGARDEIWRLALSAANQMLPELMPEGAGHLDLDWSQRAPAAVANFLRGEQAFRRSRFAEAGDFYGASLAQDSAFVLAALRGAQAAAWMPDPQSAARFARVAIDRELPPRFTHLVRGFVAYYEGRPDAAIDELERAIGLDPEMAIAWMQLGEVYRHLLPRARRMDSLAVAAFEEAARLEQGGVESYLHLLEAALNAGDLVAAAPLLARFDSDDSAPEHRARVQLMEACLRDGPDPTVWERAAHADAEMAFLAAKTLSSGGRNPACAEMGFRIVHASTPNDVGNRWGAVKGLHATLLARGRTGDATDFLDGVIDNDPELAWAARRFHILGTLVSDVPAEKAEESASRYRDEIDAVASNANNLWALTMWEAATGRVDAARSLSGIARQRVEAESERIRSLEAAGTDPEDGGEGLRRLRLIDASIGAHVALAAGDSALALQTLEELKPTATAELLSWHFFEPLGLDQLKLAELLVRRGRFEDALTVADVFDSPAPLAYLLYVPASLRVRIEAAEALGRSDLANGYRARLAALRAQ